MRGNDEGRAVGPVFHRRAALAGCGAAAVAAVTRNLNAVGAREDGATRSGAFTIGLNTSTIRGQKLPIVEIIDIAAKAGYQGMEPWLDELNRYKDGGGSLADLGKRFRDVGIQVESAIDFFEWAVDDPSRRRKGMEAARRTMDLLQKIGGKRIAAPPSGATGEPAVAPQRLAERYRELLELGDQFGVVPEVEVWGPSKTLGNLAEAAYVAVAAGHPNACILPDVYHMYRGGSPFEGLKLLGPASFHVLHFNDYPAVADREKLNDADRVYPGDGVAPLASILKTLHDGGFRVMLSLEVFNRGYWKQDPAVVAQTGFDKIKALVDGASAGS
jgi:2-keto-myo-inositol isomerase